MKFSYSLQFNTVPEWTEDYLSYGQLKKAIHDVETARLEESKGLVEEESTTSGSGVPSGAAAVNMGSRSTQLENEFLSLFQGDAQRVAQAFLAKKLASNARYEDLLESVSSSNQSSDVSVNKIEVWTGDDESLEKRRASLESSFNTVYLDLHDLHDFLDLNYTGYVRVVKNYGKYLHASAEAKRALLAKIDSILPIAELSELQGKMGQVEEVYARVMCDGSITQARAALHLLLRDRLATQRQSGILETAAEEIIKSAPIAVPDATIQTNSQAQVKDKSSSSNSNSSAKAAAGPYFTTSKVLSLAIISVVFVMILVAPRGFFGASIVDERQRALAILISCVALWITEAIPLYVTALLIPALTIVLRVIEAKHIDGSGKAITSAKTISDFVFKVIFSEMIFLLLGGFSIAAVLEKSGLTRMAAVSLLKVFGKTPSSTLLTVMIITVLASALVSNVAAPVLCFGLIQPILKNLEYDSPLARGLILGIAFGANIGGLASPIASPQSVFGFGRIKNFFSFGSWILMALPICLASTLFCWFWLRLMYPSREVLNFKEIFAVKAGGAGTMSPGKQIYILAVFAITIVLWIFASNLEKFLGPMGVTAVFPIVAYFGAGLLGKEDFNGFSWNVVILALGGSALGKTLQYSGLLNAIGEIIGSMLGSFNFFAVLTIFSAILLVITTFVSHSVGAFVFIPIIKSFSENRKDEPVITACLILASCFTCSAGMAMPISGFPNMTAASQQDRNGRNYVSTAEFSKGGIIPSIIFASSIIATVYLLGKPLANLDGTIE